MTDTRLKNCPFCGGEAGLRNTLAERKASSPTSAYVICESCLASTSYFEGSTCVSKAISAWNRRTPPAASDALSTLIYESVRFAIWACGEGISPAADEPAADPEEFVYAYVFATGDEDLDTLPGRASSYRTSPPVAAVPDGWEPTPDMVGAARSVVRQILVDAAYEFRADRRKSSAMFAAEVLVSNAMANAIKAAMLAAAPAAPTKASDE